MNFIQYALKFPDKNDIVLVKSFYLEMQEKHSAWYYAYSALSG